MNKTIYLTFDDGIEPGTTEVLEVLEAAGVRASFFLIGINVQRNHRVDADTCLRTLAAIRNGHALGNHSYTHANGWYKSYYTEGGVIINNRGDRRTVEDDFLKNEEFLECHSHGKQERRLARLPGRNTWALNTAAAAIWSGGDKDAYSSAVKLLNLGYLVFGWDVEWRMQFDLSHDEAKLKTMLQESGSFDYSNMDHVHPVIDMQRPDNLKKDRLAESWQKVAGRVLNCPYKQVVLLMHDRAFRSFQGLENPASELAALISFLRQDGNEFKTLASFNMEERLDQRSGYM